jgi:hypothetical protein
MSGILEWIEKALKLREKTNRELRFHSRLGQFKSFLHYH